METKKLTCYDLMVGDYVYSTFSDKPCKIQYIKLSEHGYGSVQVTGVDGVKDIVSLSPIPLTTEILDKNFEKDKYENYTYYEINDDFCIRNNFGRIYLAQWIDSECSLTQYPKLIIYLESVEQLQHALRLCGINDKEIVL